MKNDINDYAIEPLTPDLISSALPLAREVEPLFEASMADDPEFLEFINRKIKQREALIARDPEQPDEILGLIAFSHYNNAISWFAVFEKLRGKGIGSALLAKALDELDKTNEISVTTFREDNIPGIPARKVYEKFGFQDVDPLFFHDGMPRCIMKRPPQD